MHEPTEKQFTKKNVFKLFFERMFLCVKRFRPIIRVGNNSNEKLKVKISHVPHIEFLCYLVTEGILLQGSLLKN